MTLLATLQLHESCRERDSCSDTYDIPPEEKSLGTGPSFSGETRPVPQAMSLLATLQLHQKSCSSVEDRSSCSTSGGNNNANHDIIFASVQLVDDNNDSALLQPD
ncbi:hypothetical protein PENTCL1PPCAC_10454 [Pristionchus entomophagus]|uniref:Uncharacterized protein n=1 Tax=Pristionchus entomophagus TaxID=358040 RepID=A0AAV5SZD6_9BILA|nr:hypothetical protein PENTCL1PPCAC_10454 [Pristionchus entomophagus]